MGVYSQGLPLNDNDADGAKSAETNPGGSEETRWVVVEKTMGLLPAQIMADRLRYEGIPARAVQEGAGRALGLTVGILGEGRVYVPDDFVDEARRILDEAAQEPIDWESDLD